MDQFYIKEIRLHNYRAFEDKRIGFDKQMNVLIGMNASGKTTILEAVNVALGAYLAAYKTYVPGRFVINISESDVRRKSQKTDKSDVLISSGIGQYPCEVGVTLCMDNVTHEYKRVLEKKDGRTKFDGNNPMQKDVIQWEQAIKSGDGSDDQYMFPLVMYLSSARLWNENRKSDFDYDIPNRTDAYHRCLDKKRGMQMVFDYVRHLVEISAQEKNGVAYPAYTLIMKAIQKSMEGELKQGETIEYSLRYKGLALVQKDGTWIPFEDLSDGYRGVIKIVTDIATRMCILNPYLKEKTLELTPGVVVIDELDLSLHPGWQRRITTILTELFPKIQFICASHSPFIVQSLKEGQLISMEGDINTEYSGESIEDIAEDVMGVENPQYSDEKQKMYEVAQKYFEKLEQTSDESELNVLKEELEILTARYGNNPAYYAFLNQKYLEKSLEVSQ